MVSKESTKRDDESEFNGSFFIPADEDDWMTLMKRAKLKGKSLHCENGIWEQNP
jgi:hypothetical protein